MALTLTAFAARYKLFSLGPFLLTVFLPFLIHHFFRQWGKTKCPKLLPRSLYIFVFCLCVASSFLVLSSYLSLFILVFTEPSSMI